MLLLIGLGFLAFFIVALVVGVRLLLLWVRTRALPELLIGVGVLGIGPVGFGAMAVGGELTKRGIDTSSSVLMVGYLAVAIGVSSKCLFNWLVYHRQSRLWCLPSIAVAMVFSWVIGRQLVGGEFVLPDTSDPSILAQTVAQAGSLLWGAAESLRYWRQMRLRQQLGLADPVVTNRFLLWGLGAFSAGFGTAVGTIASIVIGKPSYEVPEIIASSSAFGMAAAIAMWLAFVPPASYTRWIRARASTAADGA